MKEEKEYYGGSKSVENFNIVMASIAIALFLLICVIIPISSIVGGYRIIAAPDKYYDLEEAVKMAEGGTVSIVLNLVAGGGLTALCLTADGKTKPALIFLASFVAVDIMLAALIVNHWATPIHGVCTIIINVISLGVLASGIYLKNKVDKKDEANGPVELIELDDED